MKKKLRLSMIVLLGIFLVSAQAHAGPYYLNPYGAQVSGDAMNYQLNANSVPAHQGQYVDGDVYGSGTITLHAGGTFAVEGGVASSFADVPGNQLALKALADTPYEGLAYVAGANASATIWDTLSFFGGTAGEIGTFVLYGSSHSNNPGAYGDGGILAVPVLSFGLSGLVQGSFHIPSDTDASITSFINFPLDTGPVQFLESVVLHASASWSSGEISSDIIFDPGWTFVLPPGVSLTSASGVVYPTSSVPEPTTMLLLGSGLLGLWGFRKKLKK